MVKRLNLSTAMPSGSSKRNKNKVPRYGIFYKLPTELIFVILDELDTKLLRKLVLFLPCKAKIFFVLEVLLKSRCMWNKDCFQPNLFFGHFVQVLLDGWTAADIQRAHDIVEARSGRLDMLNTVLASKEGSMAKEEVEARMYYRCVYWSAVQDFAKKGKWFNLILKAQPYFFQAKILLLIFTPINAEGNIMWDVFSGVHGQDHHLESMQAIADMAEALRILYASDQVSLHAIITLIEEIAAYPAHWTRQNICQFILYCGSDVLQYVLRGYLVCTQHKKFMHVVSICTFFPICQTQASVFAEIVFRAVDWPNRSTANLSLFLKYFYAFINQHKALFVRNTVMKAVLQRFHRSFPVRRSSRLAARVSNDVPCKHLHLI